MWARGATQFVLNFELDHGFKKTLPIGNIFYLLIETCRPEPRAHQKLDTRNINGCLHHTRRNAVASKLLLFLSETKSVYFVSY